MSEGIKNGPGISVSQIRDLFFPVGMKVISRVSPASLIGGTWEMLEEGRTLVAAGENYPVGSVGGEKNHTLVVSETPSHAHIGAAGDKQTPDSGATKFYPYTLLAKSNTGDGISYYWDGSTNYVGGDKPHNNMPPYISEYIWTRIA